MGNNYNISYVSEVRNLYHRIQKEIALFKLASGIRCIDQCGACCENPNVEAASVEMYPAALYIFQKHMEDKILNAIEEKTAKGDTACVFYHPDPDILGNGRCEFYRHRAIVCRLFGFAARRNKRGSLEFCSCKKIKETKPDIVSFAEQKVAQGIEIPVYQDYAMQIASIHPESGFHPLPVNVAIKQALEHIYWKIPKDFKNYKKAS